MCGNHISLKRLFVYLGLILLFPPGCMPPKQVQKREEPGLYNMTGWNGAYISYTNGIDYGTANAIDIEGKKGYQLNVIGPSAHVVRVTEGRDNWHSTTNIITNKLPPGLSFNGGADISGVPTDRGHWIVTLELAGIYLDGFPPGGTGKKYYKSFRQELRFHISGSGPVNPDGNK